MPTAQQRPLELPPTGDPAPAEPPMEAPPVEPPPAVEPGETAQAAHSRSVTRE